MKNHIRIMLTSKGLLPQLFSLFFILHSSFVIAQTTIPSGAISGTWQKSGSPYRITGNVYVPVGQKLTITEGVTVEFQDTWKMDVYGKIAVLGKPNDTVVFTAKNKANGWKGLRVSGQNKNDTVNVFFSRFEYFKTQEQNFRYSRHALEVDTLSGLVNINGCRFNNNLCVIGGALNLVRTKNVIVKNTTFYLNRAGDDRITGATIAQVSAFTTWLCNVLLDSLYIIQNSCNSPNYKNDSSFSSGSNAGVLIQDCTGELKNCVFDGNYASAIGAGLLYFSSGNTPFYVKNSVFRKNKSKETGSAFYVDLSNSASTSKLYIDDCLFEENGIQYWRGRNFITTEAGDLGMSHGNGLVIANNCIFRKAEAGVSIDCPGSFMTLNNCQIIQNHGIGIFVSQSGVVKANNTIIANNGWGVWTMSSTPVFTNCIIANNKPEPALIDRYIGAGYGVYSEFGGSIELRNSIVSGHRDTSGRFTNVFVGSLNPLCSYSIMEGGYDSFKYDSKVTPSKPATWVNMLDTNPEWVNPTAGSGVAYDAQAADWHLKNTCALVSPGFDAGKTFLGLNASPLTDMEGNPRSVGDAPDIGPYEIQKPNKYTRITAEPRDTAFCADQGSVSVFSNKSLGNNIGYQWQKSSGQAGPFADINGANTQQLTTNISSGSTTEWYRVIVKNTLCNNSDTSKAVQLLINPLPLPNLGTDTTLSNSGSKLLNPGTFTTYKWHSGVTTNTLTASKANLDTGKNTVWVEVTDAKGCKGSDTVIITLEPINGLENPALFGIEIYPIPAENTLHIEMTQMQGVRTSQDLSQPYTYSINSFDGRIISQGILHSNSTAIDISTLPSGAYSLHLNIKGHRYGMKVLKN